MTLTLSDLGVEPAGSPAALRVWPGRVRGTALGAWATNLNRRHGPGSADAIRQQLRLDRITLPDAPSADTWLPGWLQSALTDAIVDRFYDGDFNALEGSVLEDSQRGVGRVAKAALRGLGPARLLSRAPQLHDYTWDIGALSVAFGAASATLTVSGSPLFTYRTWLALQLMALRGGIEMTGRTLAARSASRLSADRAQLTVRWR